MAKLVGYKTFTSKKNNKDYSVANVISDFTKRELQTGNFGQKVEEVFLPDGYEHYLLPAHIGKEIDIEREISGNRVYVVGVEVKMDAVKADAVKAEIRK